MAGDYRKFVKGGQPLEIPAQAFNRWQRASTQVEAWQNGKGRGPSPADLPPQGIIQVKNASSTDRDRFQILGIDDILFAPSVNADEFQNNPALQGVDPSTDDHAGRFLVCAEPIKAGAVGRAFVFGVCPVKVNVNDANDRWADVKDGDATQLDSGTKGGAQILYKASGTGTQWALIRLPAGGGGGDSGLIWIRITGATAITGKENKWSYTWVEAEFNEFDFKDKSGGDTSDDFGPAYNGAENPNSASGQQGNGATLPLPGDYTIQPIVTGTVWLAQKSVDCNGNPVVLFSAPNGIDGSTCS